MTHAESFAFFYAKYPNPHKVLFRKKTHVFFSLRYMGYTKNDIDNMAFTYCLGTAHTFQYRSIRSVCLYFLKCCFGSWLTTIAKENKRIERRRNRVPLCKLRDHFNPIDFYDKIENDKTTCESVLSQLKPKQAEVLKLRFQREWTLGQISKKLKISKQRVAQIQHSAIYTLRSKYKDGMP